MIEKMTDEAYENIKQAHPEGTVRIETAMGTAVFRTPNRQEFKRFNAMILETRTKADALEWLARQVVVYPDKLVFDGWIDKKPGIPITVGDGITNLAGVQADADSKE